MALVLTLIDRELGLQMSTKAENWKWGKDKHWRKVQMDVSVQQLIFRIVMSVVLIRSNVDFILWFLKYWCIHLLPFCALVVTCKQLNYVRVLLNLHPKSANLRSSSRKVFFSYFSILSSSGHLWLQLVAYFRIILEFGKLKFILVSLWKSSVFRQYPLSNKSNVATGYVTDVLLPHLSLQIAGSSTDS